MYTLLPQFVYILVHKNNMAITRLNNKIITFTPDSNKHHLIHQNNIILQTVLIELNEQYLNNHNYFIAFSNGNFFINSRSFMNIVTSIVKIFSIILLIKSYNPLKLNLLFCLYIFTYFLMNLSLLLYHTKDNKNILPNISVTSVLHISS